MNMIESLRQKYSDNPYMSQKLETYIANLPMLMSEIEEDNIRSCAKRKETDKEKESFISNFMNEHLYYYIPQSELFIEYNKKDYRVVSEDDITHCIFNAIHSDKKVQQWKYKINISIIKKIKEHMLLNTIPESCTIQYVLRHIGPYFDTKNHAKYFLTIVGDTLLGKKDNLIYFVDPSYKMLIKNISQYVYMMMNKTIHDIFKNKYYDHKYEHCRNIDSICRVSVDDCFIKNNILNIITIATHYSSRFNSSDGFLEKCKSKEFVDKINILKNISSSSSLIGGFLQEYTIPCKDNTTYRDVYYLWRMFLMCNRLPLVVSQNNFKTILQEQGLYDPASDKCNGIASRYPSYWIQFSKFWKQNVTASEDNYYEIEELVSIYNDWCELPNLHINEEIFNELISLYHPSVIIEDNKYIMNIQCLLWNKHSGIDISMESYKYQEHEPDKYNYYCKYITQHHKSKYIASKQYFEKYIIGAV